MGLSSDWAIDLHNEQMESDEDYRAAYEQEMECEQWREEQHFKQLEAEEKITDWFGDYRLSADGFEEQDEIVEPVILIDDDIPF